MGEGVGPDDRLVRLDDHAGDLAHEPAGLGNFLRDDLGVRPVEILAGAKAHHDLFHRGVARPLPDPVDGALHLAGALHHGGQRVGDSHAEVIVTVHGDHGLFDVGHVLPDAPDESAELLRRGVAHGVGDVDGRRARLDRGLQHLVEVLDVRARCVHGRELDVLHVATGARHHFNGPLAGLFPREAELVLEMDVRRRDERVDADLGRALQGFPGAVNVLRARAGQAADCRAFHFLRDAPHGLKVARRAVRESGLDDVYAEPRQLFGHHQLLVRVHGRAGRLLAVPERRVEDADQTTHLIPSARRAPVPVPGYDGPSGAPG